MSATFAHASMGQRLKQAEGMCKSIHTNSEDVNQNNPNLAGNPIQLSFDFSYITETKKKPRVEKIDPDAKPDSLPKKRPTKNKSTPGKKKKPR